MNDNTPFTGKTFQEEGMNVWETPSQPAEAATFQEEGTNFAFMESGEDRLSRLAKVKSKALERLNSGASLQNSFTDMGDGWLESNANKMWNDVSDQGIQSLYAEVMGKYLTTDANGRTFFADGTEYKGSTRRAYFGGTKDNTNDVVKFGLARSDKPSSAARYDPEQGGWVSGEKGVDSKNFETDVLLPYGAATMLEAVIHGRKKALEGRVIKDMFANPNAKAAYGGGASEYYKNREALFGAPVDVDKRLGKELFDKFMKKLPANEAGFYTGNDYSSVSTDSDGFMKIKKELYDYNKAQDTTLGDMLSRGGNALSAFGATFINELLVKPLDAVGDLTGLYDLDTEGDAQKSVEDFFGYDSYKAEQAQHKMGEYWDVVANSEATVPERMRAAGNGLLEMFITPEMMGTSFGALMAWVAPGTVLTKGIGVGSKFANAAKTIDASVKAGTTTKSAGRIAKAKKFMELDGAKGLLASQSGQITASLGNVNKQFEEFVANNNGVVPEGWSKAKFFAERLPIQLINQNLDKLVTLDIMKGPGVVKALAPAIKSMTEKEFGNVVIALTKGMAVTIKNSGEEAVQEYAQTSMELYNSRFGSEQFKDLDTFTKFITDPRQIREAGIASLSGAGGAGQFELAGAVNSGIRGTVRKIIIGSQEESPESEATVSSVNEVAAGMATFASDNFESNPVAAFYAAQASDSEEAKTKANDYAAVTRNSLLDGSNSVFNSDVPTSPEGVSRAVEVAVAAGSDIDFTVLNTAIERSIQNKGEVVTEEMSTAIHKAYAVGTALKRIKTMTEVSGEVSTGAYGFKTYYSAAKAAEHIGDKKAEEASIEKLEMFFNYASTKSDRLKSGLESVVGLVTSEAEALVANKKAENFNDALKMKGEEYKKRKNGGVVTVIKNSDKPKAKTTYIPHYDVALNLRTQDSQTPFEEGIYNLIKTIDSEIKSMDYVLRSLRPNSSTKPSTVGVSAVTPVQESQEVDIDQQLAAAEAELNARTPPEAEEYKLPEAIAEWVDSNKDNPYAKLITQTVDNGQMTKDKEDKVLKGLKKRGFKIAQKEAGSFKEELDAAESERELSDNQDELNEAAIELQRAAEVESRRKAAKHMENETFTSDDDFDLAAALAGADESNSSLDESTNSEMESLKEEDLLAMLSGVDNEFDYPDMDTSGEPSEDSRSMEELLAGASSDVNVDENNDSLAASLAAAGQDFPTDGNVLDDWDGDNAGSTIDDYVNTSEDYFSRRSKRVEKEQDASVKAFQDLQNGIKELTTKLNDRKDALRNEVEVDGNLDGMSDIFSNDAELESIKEQLEMLKDERDALPSTARTNLNAWMDAFDGESKTQNRSKDVGLELVIDYDNKDNPPKFKLRELFGDVSTTAFTIKEEVATGTNDKSSVKVNEAAKTFLSNLTSDIKTPVLGATFSSLAKNITGMLIHTVDGGIDYNNVQAIYTAVNDYVLGNSEELFGADRKPEDVAKILSIGEHDVTDDDLDILGNGGVTLRLAAADIGKTVLKNLGIKPNSITATNALATQIGINAIRGYVNKKGTGIESSVMTRAGNAYGSDAGIDLLKGSDQLLNNLDTMRDANKDVEERLKVKINSNRGYRKAKKDGPRVVKQHRAEHLNAPKEHTDTVNRLENTAFKFNSGHEVLLKLFGNGVVLNKEALMDKIIGERKSIEGNKDEEDSYDSQRKALQRSLDNYTDAYDDVGAFNAELFFDWFIAKNHRMHLDSSGINPQGDKHIARWLITAAGGSVDIELDTIDDVVNGKYRNETDHYNNHEVMTAKTFAYAIVQAFDGAKRIPNESGKVNGVPGIDKDPEHYILDMAKDLLDETKYSDETLLEMAKQADHVGHAALAIANIRKYRDSSGTLDSDMVLEVDGLTNGFAFRALQYPVNESVIIDENTVGMREWLEKVGVVQVNDSSPGISDLESMNAARDAGQEDVYITSGLVFGGKVKKVRTVIKPLAKKDKRRKSKDFKMSEKEITAGWISLFETHKKLPDFSLKKDDSEEFSALLKFIRNLMKSPTMIFGYAAGLKKIANGLVNDQVMGKGYLKGKGLIPFLTSKKDGEYEVTKDELIEVFGEELGGSYDTARAALSKKSITYKGSADIVNLRKGVTDAITTLYADPLKETLEELFKDQTEVNAALIQAGEFLFQNFENMYNNFKMGKVLTEKDKLEWLKTYATIIPGISGASSTDQRTKLMFLKNVLEETSHSVRSNYKRGGDSKLYASARTVTRGYGTPGVGPAVLTILSLDSSNLATSINEFYKENDYAPVVPVHDAIVLGVATYGIIKQYSKDFYLINKRYSIVEEFEKAVDALSRRLTGDEKLNLTIPGGFDNNGNKKDPIGFFDMQNNLKGVAGNVIRARARLFKNDFKIGQMVGPNGTMYITDVAGDKAEAIDYVVNFSDRITNLMNHKELKAALGPEAYKKHKSLLSEMLKGCKK